MAESGLSVEALEDVIDWREQSHNAQAARAELAALVEAAGRVGPLRAALSGLLGGIDRDDRPHAGQSLCRGLHTLRAVDEAIALVVGGAAGRGGHMSAPGLATRLVAGDDRCAVCDGYGFFWRYPRWGLRHVEDNPPVRVDCPACRGTGREEAADAGDGRH